MTQDAPRRIPTANDVISALSRTGFILEYRVAQVLRELGFSAEINYAFPDPDTGKSREVDVLAFPNRRYVKNKAFDISLDLELIVECKSGEHPVILLGERGHEFDLLLNSLHLAFDPLKFGFTGAKSASILGWLSLWNLPALHSREEFTGTQLLRMSIDKNSWRADNTAIYDSLIYPLAKACHHQVSRSKEHDTGSPDWRYPSITFFFPIIVTAGPVFIVDVTTGEPKAERVPWATLRRYFDSKDIKDDFFIDVVTFDRLNDYLTNRTLRVLENLCTAVAANSNLYDPEWLIDKWGTPRKSQEFDAWRQAVRDTRAKSSGLPGAGNR
jgi:hypothetical protein